MEISFEQNPLPPVTWTVRFCSIIADLSWIVTLYCTFLLLGLSPVLSPKSFSIALAGLIIFYLAQWTLLGTSLGRWIWGIQPTKELHSYTPVGRFFNHCANVFHVVYRRAPRFRQNFVASFLTLKLIVVSSIFFQSAIREHPFIKPLQITQIEVDPPSNAKDRRAWVQIPFYYLMGLWPRQFDSHPVLYSTSYLKGPPKKFLDHVNSYWESTSTELIIEGPKTPTRGEESEVVRGCLTASETPLSKSDCRKIQEKTLSRHLQQMKNESLGKVEIKWFEVNNLNLAEEERPRGVYLSAYGKNQRQERYVLITARGIHQTLVLNHPYFESAPDELAESNRPSRLLKMIVSNLKVADHLSPARAWTNRSLAQTKLDEIKDIDDSTQVVSKLAEIQALLLSKITLEPQNFDAFFHLGGTAFMMARHAAELKTRRNQIAGTEFLKLVDQWSAVSKPLVSTSLRYAKDIDPKREQMAQLERLWIETQKSY